MVYWRLALPPRAAFAEWRRAAWWCRASHREDSDAVMMRARLKSNSPTRAASPSTDPDSHNLRALRESSAALRVRE